MATRVIIRAQVSEFPDPTMEDIISIIQAFTSVDGFQSIGIDDGQHYVHIEPQQDYARPRASFHVILDFYIKNHSEAANLPHRLYRAQRAKDDTILIARYKDPLLEQNMIKKLRVYTDEMYPWGQDIKSARAKADANESCCFQGLVPNVQKSLA